MEPPTTKRWTPCSWRCAAPPHTETLQRADIHAARATHAKDPANADNVIWLARRYGYAGQDREAIKVLTEGIHSGDASGLVPSSFRILRHVLDRLEDMREDLNHNDFADDVNGAKKGMDLHNEAKKRIHKMPVETIDSMGQRLLQR